MDHLPTNLGIGYFEIDKTYILQERYVAATIVERRMKLDDEKIGQFARENQADWDQESKVARGLSQWWVDHRDQGQGKTARGQRPGK